MCVCEERGSGLLKPRITGKWSCLVVLHLSKYLTKQQLCCYQEVNHKENRFSVTLPLYSSLFPEACCNVDLPESMSLTQPDLNNNARGQSKAREQIAL